METRRIAGLSVQEDGVPDAEAILLSAGLGGSGAYWQPQIAALAARYKVITYDHRGTGKSDRGGLPTQYAVADMADDIRAILDGLDLPHVHLVGHAAGGLAALELARIAPDRVATLTVVNGWAKADPHFVRCFEIRRAIYDAGGPDAYLRAQPLFLFPSDWISRHLANLDAQAASHAHDFQDRATLFARMAALQAFDGRDWLAQIRCPTLVMASADDMLVPPHASQALAELIAHAELALFPWGGHAVNVTAPDRVNDVLLDFLHRHRI